MNYYFSILLGGLKSVHLFNLITEFSFFTVRAMSKRRAEKAQFDEEIDRARSSDGSVLENSINSDVKNRKSRKCKLQGSNKTSTILKSKNIRSAGANVSSSDSLIKEEECSMAQEGEKFELNAKNLEISQQKSHEISIENKFDTLPVDIESQFKINSDKYSKLLNVFNGKEEDFNYFIKNYKIWQQSLSKSAKNPQTKKKETESKTLKKLTKSKIHRGTPVIKLTSPNSKKLKKYSNKNSDVLKDGDSGKDGTPISLKTFSNPLTLSMEEKDDVPVSLKTSSITSNIERKDIPATMKATSSSSSFSRENLNHIKPLLKVENLGSAGIPLSENGQLDVHPIEEEKTMEEKLEKDCEMEHESITNTGDVCIIEVYRKCEKDLDNSEIKGVESIEKLPADFQTTVNSVRVLEKVENKDFPEAINYTGPDRYCTSGNNTDFIHQDECEVDSVTEVASSESLTHDSSKSCENTKPPCDKNLNSFVFKTHECLLSDPGMLLNAENEVNEQERSGDNVLFKSYSKDNLVHIVGANNSNLNERVLNSENFTKRKRALPDDKSDYAKKAKSAIELNESNFCELQKNKCLLDLSCNNWNTEEANLLSDELIYSDEEKNIDSGHTSSNAVNHSESVEESDEQHDPENANNNVECANISRSDESLLDLHETKFIGNSDLCHIENISKKTDGEKFFQVDEEYSERSVHSSNRDTLQRSLYNEWKEKKKVIKIKNGDLKLQQDIKNKEKVTKINCKSKKNIKNKLQRKRFKKPSLNQNDVKGNYNDLATIKDLIHNEISNETLLKKVKKKYRSGKKSILESDLPVVEITYKGESLHGILGSEQNVNLFKMYCTNKNKENKEDLLNSSHTKSVLKQYLSPLCCEMVRNGACNSLWSCKKEHKVHKDFFHNMNKYDAWLVIAVVLHISENISVNFIEAIIEFLGHHKAKKKVLLVSRHLLQQNQNDLSYLKSCWEQIFKALECCGLLRWEAMKLVVQFIIDTHTSLETEVLHQLLKVWNVHSSTLADTWSIVGPLVIEKKMILSHLILLKIIGEVITVEPEDKINVYKILTQQLISLSKENLSQISYRLLNDFLRKLAQEGLHYDEKLLREKMNVTYYSPICPQQSPLSLRTQSSSNLSSLRRCKSLTNLANINTDSNFLVQTKVHEEEKMEAAIFRALQCANYDSVIKVIINCSKKKFVAKILFSIYKFVLDKHTYTALKFILAKLQEYSASVVEEVKDLIGHIVVTVMLDYVKQYKWKEANVFYALLEENNINKYKLKSLSDATLRPVRLAVTYSEVHYYNGRYKESIGVLISMKLINPESSQWLVPGGSKDDFNVINVMVSFLMNELMNKKIINIATMLFKAVLEVQISLNEPIDIGGFYEFLSYKLFEMTDEYPETAVKLYIRVSTKDRNISLNGLTYRALIILAYRTHRRSIIKDLFYKAVDEYVYPIIEENENKIMLLRSHTEEEIIVYITEWVAKFKEKLSNNDTSTCDYQIQIKFKDVVLEDFLDDQVLGIPAVLKEIDQSLPGAIKRLEFVLKRLHIQFKQIKKDTLSIEPLSFQIFLNKIKI